MKGADDFGWHCILALQVMVILMCFGQCSTDRLEKKIDALQATQDQTVDFLSDVHAERAK